MKALALILKTLGDFFLDKNGDGDEKRFWGNVLMAVAVVVVIIWKPGTDTWATAGGLITAGTTLLWKASSADSTPPAPPSNPTQGVPGS